MAAPLTRRALVGALAVAGVLAIALLGCLALSRASRPSIPLHSRSRRAGGVVRAHAGAETASAEKRFVHAANLLNPPCVEYSEYIGCVSMGSRGERRRLLQYATRAATGMTSATCQLLCYSFMSSRFRGNLSDALRQGAATNYEVRARARETAQQAAARRRPVRGALTARGAPRGRAQYFAMLGDECYCAHNLLDLGAEIGKPRFSGTAACGEPCALEGAAEYGRARACGDDRHLAVYTTGYPLFLGANSSLVRNVNELPCLAGTRYVGCFRHGMRGCGHNGPSAVLDVQPYGGAHWGFSTTECRNACYMGNYTFYGLALRERRCFCGMRASPNDAIPKPPSSCGGGGGYEPVIDFPTPFARGGCAKQGFYPPTFTCGQVSEGEHQLSTRYSSVTCWMPVYCTGLDWHDCSRAGLYA